MFEMDDGARGWLMQTAAKNYWRVAGFMEWEDLIQEGQWQWARTVDRYGSPPEIEMRQLMALFKRVFMSHLATITDKQRRRPEIISENDERWEVHIHRAMRTRLNVEDMYLPAFLDRLRSAPPEVRKVLEALATDANLVKLARPYRRCFGHRETMNERLCKLIGADPEKVKLVNMLRSFLREGANGSVL